MSNKFSEGPENFSKKRILWDLFKKARKRVVITVHTFSLRRSDVDAMKRGE
jgi:hypothetical protein